MSKIIMVCLIAAVMLAGCAAGNGAGTTSDWSITVTSAVGTKTLTLANLKALPQTELEYLAKETGTTNKYKGPALKEVIKAAGADLSAAQSVDVEAEDAFFATFSRDLALRNDVVLVIEMDGGPLPAEMGTARVIAPGETTKFQVKFVKRITVK
jgi:DMSO/TMAO reductase YedYZ molybdopterin-dependent catalytic subunit